jgi:hypothetical protein
MLLFTSQIRQQSLLLGRTPISRTRFLYINSREACLAAQLLQQSLPSKMSQSRSQRKQGRIFPTANVREPVVPFWSPNLSGNPVAAKGAPTKPMKLIYTVHVNGRTWFGVVFPMSPINRLVVHHTWSLFRRSQDQRPDNVYGDNFTYEEIIATPRFYKAVFYLLGLSAFLAGLLFPPVRLFCLPERVQSF